jgi:hypothetical protein
MITYFKFRYLILVIYHYFLKTIKQQRNIMLKYLILLFFSFNIIASDIENKSADEKFSEFLESISGDLLSLEESLKLQKNLTHQENRKRSAEPTDNKENHPPKKQKKEKQKTKLSIAKAKDGLIHHDIATDDIETYLNALDQLTDTRSYTRSFAMNDPEAQEDAYKCLEKDSLAPFIPLFKQLIDTVLQLSTFKGETVLHMAIRVDPNASTMHKDRERKFTQGWHRHEGTDRYLFALTRTNNLTTMIKEQGVEQYIEMNRLFFLPGSMEHRTPDSSEGKRIQLSISVDKIIND